MATRSKSRRNDGSVTLRKDGRWQGRYMATLPDGTRKRQSVYGKTAEETRSLMRKEMHSAGTGSPVLHNGLQVENYLYEWIKVATRINEGTRKKYLGVVRKHIVPAIGKTNLSTLTPMQVQKMLNDMLARGISVRVAQITRNVLSSALRHATTNGLVSMNAARHVDLPTYEMVEKKVWNEEQAKTFRAYAKKNKYHFTFEMMLTYGIRRGEALAIAWDDIDLVKKVIHIRKQYTYMGNGLEICKPKTKNSVRDLPLLPHIEAILGDLVTIGMAGPVVAVDGLPVNPNSLRWEFKRIIKDTGLPYVTLHSLRHFVATSLKESDVSIKDAQMILGHASPYTTMQHYQHSTIGNKKDALEKYAEMMAF